MGRPGEIQISNADIRNKYENSIGKIRITLALKRVAPGCVNWIILPGPAEDAEGGRLRAPETMVIWRRGRGAGPVLSVASVVLIKRAMGNAIILTVECCMCHRVHGASGWDYPSERQTSGRVSHGYCPACYRKAMVDLERDFSLLRVNHGLLTEAQ